MEQVMVTDSQWISAFWPDTAAGIVRDPDEQILTAIRSRYRFIDRAAAESDFGSRQMIPYLILAHNGYFLVTTRLKGQSEARLHGKLSLGIGGHINPCPAGEDPIQYGLVRELNEEIGITLQDTPVYKGIILDDTTEVSRVHLGLVYWARAQTAQFTIREPEKMTAQWMDAVRLRACCDRMETWSQLVWKHLIA